MTRLLVLGYYDKDNFGDDLFKYVFQEVFQGEEETLEVQNMDHIDSLDLESYDKILIGGGDIVNDYF